MYKRQIESEACHSDKCAISKALKEYVNRNVSIDLGAYTNVSNIGLYNNATSISREEAEYTLEFQNDEILKIWIKNYDNIYRNKNRRRFSEELEPVYPIYIYFDTNRKTATLTKEISS